MSSADFRHIAVKGKLHRSERLFRAAVSAFCALTRPSRSEIAQLEDLTLPLFDAQPKESKRFAAAALSDAAEAPNALIRRLCDETVDIAAPLLIRSKTLSDMDLIGLICRHGLPHARAVARRSRLHPSIEALVRALEAKELRGQNEPEELPMPHDALASRPALELVSPQPLPSPTSAPSGEAAERMRHRLRGVMASAAQVEPAASTATPIETRLARLKVTALSGNPAFFQTALADALEVDLPVAREIATAEDYTSLIAALKSLEMKEEQAFLLTATVFPASFSNAAAIRLFIESFRLMRREAAKEALRGWRAASAARSPLRKQSSTAGNSDAHQGSSDRLRAS